MFSTANSVPEDPQRGVCMCVCVCVLLHVCVCTRVCFSCLSISRAVYITVESAGVKCCVHSPPLSEDNLIVSYILLHDIISLRSSLICSVCSNQSLSPPSQVSCKAAKNCPVLCSCTCFKDLRARAATETAM